MTAKINYLLLSLSILLAACNNSSLSEKISDAQYLVKKVQKTDFDYLNPEAGTEWDNANENRHFIYPWENNSAPSTIFKALYDNNFLYLYYEATDTDLFECDMVNTDSAIINTDRVEFYFLQNGSMKTYKSIEMDVRGRLLDYEAKFHRNFDQSWTYPKDDIKINSTKTLVGFRVIARISIKSLKNFDAFDGNKMYVGVFRANVVQFIDNEATYKWISWVDPKVTVPDFHCPSAIGTFVFE